MPSSVATAFLPLGGFTPDTPAILSPPSSFISAQNVWVHENQLQPRWRLSTSSFSAVQSLASAAALTDVTNPGAGGQRIVGCGLFDMPDRGPSTFIASNLWSGTTSNLYFSSCDTANNTMSWSVGSYKVAGAADLFPSLGTNATWFATECYSLKRTFPLLVLAGDVTPSGRDTTWAPLSAGSQHRLYWAGPLQTPGTKTVYSEITMAPRAYDVVTLQNRVVAWGADEVPQRCQWSVAGDPEDWLGIGSGFQDLADAKGWATRVFLNGDELLLATEKELWRGRYVGDPYAFAFAPLTHNAGIPYPRAAVQTPHGIFWLADNCMICRVDGNALDLSFGAKVQHWLRTRLVGPDVALMSYDDTLNHLRLWYATTTGSYPTEGLVYDFETGEWFPEHYNHAIHAVCSPRMIRGGNPQGGTSWQARLSHVVFTSGATVATLRESATSELGTSTEEDATFGTLLADNFERRATCQELRLDLGAPLSASSATVSLSTTFGQTTAFSQRLAISANSNTSQFVLYPKVTDGPQFTPRIQSTNGSWRLARVFGRFDNSGELR